MSVKEIVEPTEAFGLFLSRLNSLFSVRATENNLVFIMIIPFIVSASINHSYASYYSESRTNIQLIVAQNLKNEIHATRKNY